MWEILKFNAIIERFNKKNIVSLITVIAIVAGSILYMQSTKLSDQLMVKKGDFYTTYAALSKFPTIDTKESDNSPMFVNLTEQKRYVALQIAALTMDNYEMYYEASYNLAKYRKMAFEIEQYDKVANLLPSYIENELDFTYFKYMYESSVKGVSNSLEYIPFLLFFFSVIGFGWYMFMSVYTSTLLLDDFDHSSVVRGLPVQFSSFIFAKCLIAFGYMLAFIGLIFIVALPLIWIKGWSSVAEYVPVYVGEVKLYTVAQYIGIVILYMLVVGFFAMLLSIILNVLLKNMYLTLFVHGILFFLPIFVPSLISRIPLNPYNFMEFNRILDGVPLSLAQPVNLHIWHGFTILVGCIVLMLVVIKLFFSTGKLKRV